MAGRRRDYDEHPDDASFDRAKRSGSRPRTKDRPDYSDAPVASVVAVDRGRYTCRLDDQPDLVITAMKARELGRGGVIVGDRVRLTGDLSGAEGSLARVVEVTERQTLLRRSADDNDPVERPLVANADQLVIVTALADPEPNPRFIDRCLVAAYDAHVDPLLCLTKADLATPDGLLAEYRPLQVPAIAVSRSGDLAELRERLARRVSVLIGPSGVGKTTLVNALVPGTDRATGGVNVVTGRGRHTSTSAVSLELPDGGRIIDTPGIRSFGLAHVEPDTVVGAFPDLAEAVADCPRGCDHQPGHECALDEAADTGRVTAARVESLRRLLSSRD